MPDPEKAAAEAARDYEEQIAQEAKAIREEALKTTPAGLGKGRLFPTLTRDIFDKLYPLLCKPIHEAHIQTVGKLTGKPYESTGISSVQVQIDRMNNVLTPLWWRDEADYSEGGKLCKVTVQVGDSQSKPMIERSSYGGVDRGSSLGNIYKGSYTNAAKLAFARLGPGREVYLGTTDLDPDVDQELAEDAGQRKAAPGGSIGPEIAKTIVDNAWKVDEAKKNFRLAASHEAGSDVGDCSTKAKAQAAIEGLSFETAERLNRWITKKGQES